MQRPNLFRTYYFFVCYVGFGFGASQGHSRPFQGLLGRYTTSPKSSLPDTERTTGRAGSRSHTYDRLFGASTVPKHHRPGPKPMSARHAPESGNNRCSTLSSCRDVTVTAVMSFELISIQQQSRFRRCSMMVGVEVDSAESNLIEKCPPNILFYTYPAYARIGVSGNFRTLSRSPIFLPTRTHHATKSALDLENAPQDTFVAAGIKHSMNASPSLQQGGAYSSCSGG